MESFDFRARFRQSTAFAALLLLAGTVSADPPIITPPVTVPPYPVIDYTALWSELSQESVFYTTSSLAGFEDQIDDLALTGYRLDAFESWLVGANRHYAGIFKQSGGTRVLVTGLTAAAFETERLTQASANRLLLDVEVELVGGVRVYSGLFYTALMATQQVHDGLTAAQLEAEIVSSAPSYRLGLFDTWWESGELRSYSVFTSVALTQTAVIALPWDDFLDEAEILAAAGYRLIDIEITEVPQVEGGVDLFSGRFLVKGDARDWLSACLELTADLVANHWLFSSGYYFSSVDVDLEFIEEPTHEPMGMLDLEVGRDWMGGTIITPNLVKPIHDSGTPGPPRWP